MQNCGQDKDHQPAHKEIEKEAKFFIDFFGKDFVENTENGQTPLQAYNQIAQPTTDQGKGNRCVTSSDGNVNHAMVDNSQDVFVNRSIGHGVVDGRGQKHEEKTDNKDRHADHRCHVIVLKRMDCSNGEQD